MIEIRYYDFDIFDKNGLPDIEHEIRINEDEENFITDFRINFTDFCHSDLYIFCEIHCCTGYTEDGYSLLFSFTKLSSYLEKCKYYQLIDHLIILDIINVIMKDIADQAYIVENNLQSYS